MARVAVTHDGDAIVLDNGQLHVRIEADGTVSSIVDQRTNRELVPAGTRLGRYEMLKDEPFHWDAWDIQRDAFLTANALSEASITSVDETANGGAVVHAVTRAKGVEIRTGIALRPGSATLDFTADVDWHAVEQFLKVDMPVTVQAVNAQYECQYGLVERPINKNTRSDDAKFESCTHRFVRIADADYAAAVVNASTYGSDVSPIHADTAHGTGRGTMVRLSLLSAPLYPDPRTDQGAHSFAWSLVADADMNAVLDEAARLNSPVIGELPDLAPLVSLTDVTADHEIRARLERAATAAEDANRAKSSFLSSMSHDIRTPMNAILGFSTLIDREADNPAHVRDYNRKIATSGQHLLGLINDVLDMSKIEAGKTTLAASAFALSGTVESVEAMMRQQTDAKNQVFTVEVDKVEHDRLVGDEGRLRQILMNLLSNAMKYTPEGGHILFRVDGSAKRHGKLQHLRIIVRDDGIGMSKDYLATIFDSFTREESSLTNKVQGTGLGMAITKNLVDLMGGTISVESELGTGSTFIVDLDFPPAGDESDGTEGDGGKRAGDASGTGENALAHKHVLVAEDNALNAEVITAILNIHDATCEVAANGKEAVAKFGMSAPGTFDMIFMDVQMPVMNGHDTARAIRAMDRPDAGTIPIIAMTANAFAEDERQALACGMNAHVAKPIDVHTLERVVAELS